jgi:tRNA (cmo5U34)-methyltransferase
MVALLLAERAPAGARVLVLGAGGGLELKVFAEAHANWTFDGVDPSAEMLKLAEATLGPLAPRARLHEGYIDAAPEGPFDAATCLLTFHFVRVEERARTLAEIRRRMKPDAPFVLAHLSFPQGEPERDLWLSRYFAFSGIEAAKREESRAAVNAHLTILDPEREEVMLRDAGFSNVTQFYQGFAFRGWVASA